MIEVRIRHYDDAEAVHLAEVPLTEAGLDEVVRLIDAWGVYTKQEGDATTGIVGQFAIGDAGAYFEIIVGDDE